MTFQKFYRVTGSSTQNKGVTPDIELPSAFNAKQYGESSNPSALPWDVIKSTSFEKTGDVNEKIVASLLKSYAERMKADPMLKKYISETEILKKNLADTRISLNEEDRKKEMAEAEKDKAGSQNIGAKVTDKDTSNNQNMGTKIPDKESSGNQNTGTKIADKEASKVEVLNMDDEYLREGLLMLSELALKRVG